MCLKKQSNLFFTSSDLARNYLINSWFNIKKTKKNFKIKKIKLLLWAYLYFKKD